MLYAVWKWCIRNSKDYHQVWIKITIWCNSPIWWTNAIVIHFACFILSFYLCSISRHAVTLGEYCLRAVHRSMFTARRLALIAVCVFLVCGGSAVLKTHPPDNPNMFFFETLPNKKKHYMCFKERWFSVDCPNKTLRYPPDAGDQFMGSSARSRIPILGRTSVPIHSHLLA